MSGIVLSIESGLKNAGSRPRGDSGGRDFCESRSIRELAKQTSLPRIRFPDEAESGRGEERNSDSA